MAPKMVGNNNTNGINLQPSIKEHPRSNSKFVDDKNEDPFKEILAKLNALSGEIASVKKDMKEEISKLRPLVEEIVHEQLSIREEKWTAVNETLTKRLDRLETCEESRSKADKRMNIVIHNLPTSNPVSKQVIKKFF